MATITSKMLSKKRAILPRIESDEEDVDDVDMPSTKIAKVNSFFYRSIDLGTNLYYLT